MQPNDMPSTHSFGRSWRGLTSVTALACCLLAATAVALPHKPNPAGPELPPGPVGSRQGTELQEAGLEGVVTGGVGTIGTELRNATLPLAEAGVYAVRVSDLALHKVRTGRAGEFRFGALPAGVYKVIAHKTGFVPAVAVVTRTTATSFQELQLELAPQRLGNERPSLLSDSADEFWRIRRQIPADVLRDIQIAELEARPRESTPTPSLAPQLTAKLHALTGSGDFAEHTEAHLLGANLQVDGRLGDLDVALVGNFRSLHDESSLTRGRAQRLGLTLEHARSGQLAISSFAGDRTMGSVDLERHDVSWAGAAGSGNAELSAHYFDEANYHHDPRRDHFEIPVGSRTVSIEGTYAQDVGAGRRFQTGVRYREQSLRPTSVSTVDQRLGAEQLEVFGLADVNLRESAAIEYGLFTRLNHDTVTVTPHGGLRLELPDQWTIAAAAQVRIDEQPPEELGLARSIFAAAHELELACTRAEAGCYQLRVLRPVERGQFEFGASYREFGDTLLLRFNEDLFDELDTLYLVQGDQLPELYLGFSRRLGEGFEARFRSNLASGGGGRISGGLENRVRYLVTSLEGQFSGSGTGVLVSYHSLQQRLLRDQGGVAVDPIVRDRLQLMVTQGLSKFLGLVPDLDLVLDMQISRSQHADQIAAVDQPLSHRLLGGVALRF